MMEGASSDRRQFIRHAGSAAAGMLVFPAILSAANDRTTSRIKFAVIGLNHGHIYSQVETVIKGGGELVSFFAIEPDLSAAFRKAYPRAKQAREAAEIFDDKSVQLIVSAAIPSERAAIAISAMRHGKDVMVDKPGATTLDQLESIRSVQKETGRLFSILYSERMENQATTKAGELVKAGAIGRVIQTIGTGPHRMNAAGRPDWFFHKKYYGGILTDIATHQCDQFLFFTGSDSAEVTASQTGNFNHPQYPELEDFGDAMVSGNGGTGYMRVDWFTPDSLKTWGDTRLTILGTEGYIEIRKNIDLEGRPGANHLFLVNNKETRYIDSSKVELAYGRLLVDDIVNRTETAMRQHHCFLAMELALKAQAQAKNITKK